MVQSTSSAVYWKGESKVGFALAWAEILVFASIQRAAWESRRLSEKELQLLLGKSYELQVASVSVVVALEASKRAWVL